MKVDILGFGQTNNRHIILDENNALIKKLFESSDPFDARIFLVAGNKSMLHRYGG